MLGRAQFLTRGFVAAAGAISGLAGLETTKHVCIMDGAGATTAAAAAPTSAGASPDYAAWDACVKTHVKAGVIRGIPLNQVDYKGIRDDPNFVKFLASLEGAETKGEVLGKKGYYALWVNAYNALAIKTVTDNPTKKRALGFRKVNIGSIKDVGTLVSPVWKRPAGVVGGETVSLDEIEHARLRKPKDFPADPRLHAAIVCASVSCPDMSTKAYMPETVEEDMAENLLLFLDNDKKGLRLDMGTGTLTLSKVFQWFAADFEKEGASVVDYLLPYMPQDAKAWLTDAANRARVKLAYFDYDWGLNGPHPGPK